MSDNVPATGDARPSSARAGVREPASAGEPPADLLGEGLFPRSRSSAVQPTRSPCNFFQKCFKTSIKSGGEFLCCIQRQARNPFLNSAHLALAESGNILLTQTPMLTYLSNRRTCYILPDPLNLQFRVVLGVDFSKKLRGTQMQIAGRPIQLRSIDVGIL